jgi:hypothetical protein
MSNVNPTFPTPGLDQSSRGFRDNFTVIKTELESLQNKQIQLVGSVVSNVAVIGDDNNTIVLQTTIGNITNSTGTRIITSNTTILASDDNCVLPINNGNSNIVVTLPSSFSTFAADTSILGTGTVLFIVGNGSYLNGILNGNVTVTNNIGSTFSSFRLTMQYLSGNASYWFLK